jgi:hypothetical protein
MPDVIKKLTEKLQKRSEDGPGKRSEESTALPYQAYAIVPDREDPGTWKLPHHTRLVNRAVKGKIGYEHTVDWKLVAEAVAVLSRQGVDGKRLEAPEHEVLAAAQHLASHYVKAGRPLPDALAALV